MEMIPSNEEPSPEDICTTTYGLNAQVCHAYQHLFPSLTGIKKGISVQLPSLLSCEKNPQPSAPQ